MPQKKNPDVLELIRGRTARVVGALQSILVLIKGLPLAYNRDLQEDKLALFDAVDTVTASVELAAVVVSGATLNADRIASRLDEGFLDATTLMEYLILKGVPQRTGHEVVGKLVSLCEGRGCRLADLSLDDFRAACPAIEADVVGSLGVANAVKAFRSYGSTAPAEVEEQLDRWRGRLGPSGNHPRAEFVVGRSYDRQQDLHDRFGGNRQAGISSCSAFPYIFLFSSPRGEEFGYRDGWVSESEYRYTGEGQLGDMELTRGNLAIMDHERAGKELHVFERQGAGRYRYQGRFRYAAHDVQRGPDSSGTDRSIIVFRLGLVT